MLPLNKPKRAMPDLIEDGYCLIPNVLPMDLLKRLRQTIESMCADVDRGHRRSQGIMMSAMTDPMLAELITLPSALKALADLGYTAPTFTDGYLISKLGHSPRLFWHYDWFAWKDPDARAREPQQIFLMYYLIDTTPENGCLRVIPGSHRQHNPLHELLSSPHSPELSRIDNPDNPAFSTRPDEVDVPVKAGDLIIGDARMLHAAHANTSEQLRTVITLWIQPRFAELPDRVKAQMVQKTHAVPTEWPEDARQAVESMQPQYGGHAEPYGRDLYEPPVS